MISDWEYAAVIVTVIHDNYILPMRSNSLRVPSITDGENLKGLACIKGDCAKAPDESGGLQYLTFFFYFFNIGPSPPNLSFVWLTISPSVPLPASKLSLSSPVFTCKPVI